MIAILDEQLKAAGIPIISVRNNKGIYSVVYDESATKDQITQGDQIVASFDPQIYIDEAKAKLDAQIAIAEKADADTPVTAAEIRKFMAAVSKQFGWIQ